MSTVIVRKFVIVLFTIVILMVISALLHQSVFEPSHFGISQNLGRVSTTDTDPVSSPTKPTSSSSTFANNPVLLQNKENGENVLYNTEVESQASASFSVSAPQNQANLTLKPLQKISKKNQKNFHENLIPDESGDSTKSQSDIVKNAPWPFSATGGTEEVQKNSLANIQPLASSQNPPHTVMVAERRRIARKELLPPENETESQNSSENSHPVPSPKTRTTTVQVLPPGYHVAPPMVRKLIPSQKPVPASHEVKSDIIFTVPKSDTKLPELPQVEKGNLSEFPPVEKERIRNFPPVEKEFSPNLREEQTSESKNEENLKDTNEMTQENQIPSPEITDETRGNFPLAYGEMELVNPHPHFGTRKPVSIPNVPDKKEKPNDLLTIDAIVELPDPPQTREFPQAKE